MLVDRHGEIVPSGRLVATLGVSKQFAVCLQWQARHGSRVFWLGIDGSTCVTHAADERAVKWLETIERQR